VEWLGGEIGRSPHFAEYRLVALGELRVVAGLSHRVQHGHRLDEAQSDDPGDCGAVRRREPMQLERAFAGLADVGGRIYERAVAVEQGESVRRGHSERIIWAMAVRPAEARPSAAARRAASDLF